MKEKRLNGDEREEKLWKKGTNRLGRVWEMGPNGCDSAQPVAGNSDLSQVDTPSSSRPERGIK